MLWYYGPLWSAIELALVVFHLTVIVFICRRRSMDGVLRNPFFVLYVIVSISDCVSVICQVMFMDTLNFGLIVEPLLACDICAKMQMELTTFSRLVQPLGHTLIALNRFSCFCSSSLHAWLWSGRLGEAIPLVLVLLPLVKSLTWLLQPVSYKPYFNSEYYIPMYDDPAWFDLMIRTGVFIFCASTVTSLLLSLCTTVRLYVISRRKGVGTSSSAKNSDTRLLAHSLAMFVIQSLLTLHYLMLVDCLPSFLVPFIRLGGRHFVDAYSLSGPVFLLLVSSHVRRKYLDFYRIRKPVVTRVSSLSLF